MAENFDGMQLRPLDDGTIEFSLVIGGKIIGQGVMTEEQAGVLSGNLLNCAQAAFNHADLKLGVTPTKTTRVTVTRFSLGGRKGSDEFVAIVEAGHASIGLGLPTKDIRSFARQLIDACTSKGENHARTARRPRNYSFGSKSDLVKARRRIRSNENASTAEAPFTRRSLAFVDIRWAQSTLCRRG